MPRKSIELPPDVAKAFVKDMRAYFAYVRDRPTMSNIPPICGSNAKRTSRSLAKSSGAGRNRPWDTQATSLMAASV